MVVLVQGETASEQYNNHIRSSPEPKVTLENSAVWCHLPRKAVHPDFFEMFSDKQHKFIWMLLLLSFSEQSIPFPAVMIVLWNLLTSSHPSCVFSFPGRQSSGRANQQQLLHQPSTACIGSDLREPCFDQLLFSGGLSFVQRLLWFHGFQVLFGTREKLFQRETEATVLAVFCWVVLFVSFWVVLFSGGRILFQQCWWIHRVLKPDHYTLLLFFPGKETLWKLCPRLFCSEYLF